jgi:hypothetical protein
MRLRAEPPELEQEQEPVWFQSERLQARQAGPLLLMQQRIPLVWEQRAAWEEQVSPA